MTNWEVLFGTPEKTANSLRALMIYHDWEDCESCFMHDKRDGGCLAYAYMDGEIVKDNKRLEWLQEEAS